MPIFCCNCNKIPLNTQDFWFWTHFQKIKKIPVQGDHSKFEFLECCLKNAGDPPGGSLHSLATKKFEFRVIALERHFLCFLGNRFKTRNIVCFCPEIYENIRSCFLLFFGTWPQKIMKTQLFGHSLNPRALGTVPGWKGATFYSGYP